MSYWDFMRGKKMGHYDEQYDKMYAAERDEIVSNHQEDQSKTEQTSAWQSQKGGTHYKDMPIQPFEYSMANGLDPMQHTIIKYVSRFRDKNGIDDLEKARHTIDLLIEWEKKRIANS